MFGPDARGHEDDRSGLKHHSCSVRNSRVWGVHGTIKSWTMNGKVVQYHQDTLA